jgi:hypothetical protein
MGGGGHMAAVSWRQWTDGGVPGGRRALWRWVAGPRRCNAVGGGRKELDLEVAESWRPLTLGSSRRIGSRGEPELEDLEVGGGPVVNEWIRKK